MNDSFLEELELIPKDSKKTTHQQADRHVTTRHATSSPLLNFSEQDRRDDTLRAHKERSIETISNIPDIRIVSTKDPSLKDPKKPFDRNVKKHSVSIKTLEKNEKSVESKGKLVDVRVKVDNNKQQNISGDHKIKLQETRHLKVPENKIVNRDRNWRSGSHKENSHLLNTSIKENRCSPDSSNNHSSDVSSKENSRPSDSSRETGFVNSKKEKERLPDKVKRSGFTVQEQDPVGLLTAIKELISTYTKQESTKILRAMQELHINSQATLIKNLLNQTNDLIKEVNPGKDSARISFLIEENEQLKQELITLQVRTEDLQNKLEEFESLKQENAALKLKCHE
ncbi:hypothetical protein DMN91_007188 [Ooceraea biroi]|nr:uncharacterized protein LOC105279275 [Ooceraea biroi]XP_011337238.2 uncharacterized protein LOC105279275 [Ooceraea biroi]RLU20577.1 hypothetical protein DMN91_007188 [Ooceraea biroi]